MKFNSFLAIAGFVLFSLLVFWPANLSFDVPHVSLVGATDVQNASASSLTVSAIVDASINCSSLSLGTFTPGVINRTVTNQQCNMTIYSITNTQTNISINGSDLSNGSTTLAVDNITYSNNSGGVGSCNSSLRTALRTGSCTATLPYYFDWVNIADPTVDTTVNFYFFVSVPSTQKKGLYTGTFYVKVADVV